MQQLAAKISQLSAGEAYNHWMMESTKYYSGNLDVFSYIYRSIIAHIFGIKIKDKPIGKILLVGPSGSGKSYIAEVVAKVIHNDINKFIPIDGSEFGSDHEVAKLFGAPSGYIGHKETEPIFSDVTIKESYKDSPLEVCIMRVDEIDKASSKFHHSFMGPMESGFCKNGTNKKVDFSNVFFIFTANSGDGSLFNRKGFSMSGANPNKDKGVRELLTKNFSKAFLNRMDHSILMASYSKEEISNAVKLQVELYLNELGQYGKLVTVDESFYEEFSSIPYDKDFGLRDMIRDAKSIIKESAIDRVLYNGNKDRYIIDSENVREHMELKNAVLGVAK